MKIEKYSFGTGDRFGMQGKAQLGAIMKAVEKGVDIVPVWNKSNREHQTIHTDPEEVRFEADQAVNDLKWTGNYYVDADHINLSTVDRFMEHSDFFTIDVADFIGKKVPQSEIDAFLKENERFIGKFELPGLEEDFNISSTVLQEIAGKYLYAIKQASAIYQHILNKKGEGNFIPEVSMDEVNDPQSPVEMFFILSGLASENLPLQTIAPKFSGRFNKGVDYVGDINRFRKEFHADLLVIDKALTEFSLPANLKLSVHSGSDKFSIYPVMGELIAQLDKGLHVKTAGTTWLEEMIGLAVAGDDALELAKSIYRKALARKNELCAPYATVIDIDDTKLPTADEVDTWDGNKFADSLRHIPTHPDYNPSFRQLIHVGYKVAAEYANVYLSMVKRNEQIVAQQVSENIYDRHLKRLFNL